MPKQTPSQTVGPYFAYGLTPQPYGREGIADGRVVDRTLSGAALAGHRITVTGRVLDGAKAPVIDAMIEIWQADAQGRYAHPADGREASFHGFGRTGTDGEGAFRIETIKPGPVAGADARPQAPHLNVAVFARGMPNHAYTRVYFSDETAANEADMVLNLVGPDRRNTLVAMLEKTAGGPVYRFDIRLQGEDETVFFDA
ncbi:protocatechuate 3,4-dioxygenase subunit alpha [Skermanella stibiiresistens SB22]|uniref:Protocatechuate 3,4-dioxygenase subunit alpha n=1 Tax=Skermanella stibiiresistens SB22 TaxID=1385369 RepID=W9GRQ3_9PROT|nr:protocatechuate 3,4-dioxygenase subunit alpha [Skermanella stibiiresistens]EWY36454.1 protocatechuate 3,4-dioxygenase subunit alpha [Skermanella stibiiresistens SB22]